MVEAEHPGERGDEIRRRGRGQHDQMAGLAVLGQHSRGIGWTNSTNSGAASSPAHHGLDRPAPGETRRSTHHGHEGQALAHEVVEAVQQPLARQRSATLEQPFGVHGGAQHETARPAQERAVEIHEHRDSTRHRRVVHRAVAVVQMGLRRAGRHHGADPTAADLGRRAGRRARRAGPGRSGPWPRWARRDQGRDAAKGPEGDPVPLLRLDRTGGGRPFLWSLWFIVKDRGRSVKQLLQISTIVKSDGTSASPGAGGGGRARVVLVRRRPSRHGAVQHLRPRGPAGARARDDARRPLRRPADRRRRGRGGPGLPGHGRAPTPSSPTSGPCASPWPATCTSASSAPPPDGSSPCCWRSWPRPIPGSTWWWRTARPWASSPSSAGRFDLAVLTFPVPGRDLVSEPLFEEDIVLVVPVDDDPLSGAEQIDITDLERFELLLPAPGTPFRGEIDAAVKPAGVRLRPRVELDGVRLLASLTFEGYGPAVLPATAVPPHLRARFRLVHVEGLVPRHVGIAQRSRGLPSAPARAVLGTLRDLMTRPDRLPPGVHPVLGDLRTRNEGSLAWWACPTADVTRRVGAPLSTSATTWGRRAACGSRPSRRTRGGRRTRDCSPSTIRDRREALGRPRPRAPTARARSRRRALSIGVGAEGGQVPVRLLRSRRVDGAEQPGGLGCVAPEAGEVRHHRHEAYQVAPPGPRPARWRPHRRAGQVPRGEHLAPLEKRVAQLDREELAQPHSTPAVAAEQPLRTGSSSKARARTSTSVSTSAGTTRRTAWCMGRARKTDASPRS